MNIKKSVITPDILLKAGYRPFKDWSKAQSLKESHKGSYQKRFDDEHGKKYFINFTHTHFLFPETDIEHMNASTQFDRGEKVFNIENFDNDQTLEEVEAFFEELFVKLELDYYETYDLGVDNQPTI